ncbi:hypothetical protein PS6_008437 [Mucor atramentarius]
MDEDEFERVEAPLASAPNNRHNRLLGISNRRSTILAIPMNQEEPPTEDPNLTQEENQQLRAEYKAVKSINRALESVLEDFQEASNKIHQFTETDIMSVLEDESWKQNSRKRRAVDEPTRSGRT